ncbi:glycosyltransferase family 4 protein [Pontiellaceae bacterium B12227]|nr:glycosyltransferase family 4 protein [Pontiellaceae bacterium B12227]
MTENSKFKLVVVGQTPPPFNGQTKMIEVMLNGLRGKVDLRFVRMEFSDSVSSAGKFSVGKIGHLLGLIVRAWKALGFRRNCFLYYPPASPNFIPVLRDILFLLAVRPFCRGLILHFHAGGVSRYAGEHHVLRFFMQLAYGRMDLGIVNGASCPDDPGYFKAKKTAIIPHGIDMEIALTKQASCKSDCLHILNVGIHTEEKGLFALLDTANELANRNSNFIMHTVGMWYSDEEERRFLELRKTYGLENQVICCGQKTGEDLWQEYAWADVLFFPTHYSWETMGIVQLEAMAHALPVVASDWQGPKDVVIEGVTGFLCPYDQPKVFADCLEKLTDDEWLRSRMGQAGLKRYQTNYTETVFINRLEEEFSALLH